MELRRDEYASEESAETKSHIRVREFLHELARQDQQRELTDVDAHQMAHEGEQGRLQYDIEPADALVAPAVYLALTVMHAVQRPPPRNRVLRAVHPVIRQVVDKIVQREREIGVRLD